MIKHGKVRSTVSPEPLIVDSQSVWVHSNITSVEEETFIGFEYDMIQYGKDEYIKVMSEKSNELENTINDINTALAVALGGV